MKSLIKLGFSYAPFDKRMYLVDVHGQVWSITGEVTPYAEQILMGEAVASPLAKSLVNIDQFDLF